MFEGMEGNRQDIVFRGMVKRITAMARNSKRIVCAPFVVGRDRTEEMEAIPRPEKQNAQKRLSALYPDSEAWCPAVPCGFDKHNCVLL